MSDTYGERRQSDPFEILFRVEEVSRECWKGSKEVSGAETALGSFELKPCNNHTQIKSLDRDDIASDNAKAWGS